MTNTNIIIIGGFLGAGKTTTILAVARLLTHQGKRIGIITNDQGSKLVDTEYLKSHGLRVSEVTGGCFCCNFNQLSDRVVDLRKQGELDYILAEPVGSCTDLVATIMKPIKDGKCGDLNLLPLTVIVDPLRLKAEVLESEKHLPSEVEYLMLKQYEEADVLVVNKMDLLTKTDYMKIKEYLVKKFPDKKVYYISARENRGVADWISALRSMDIKKDYSNNSLDIQYDIYAKAEADLGWLNSYSEFNSKQPLDPAVIMKYLADKIKEYLKMDTNEIAHLKLYINSSKVSCKLSCTSIYGENSIDQTSIEPINQGSLVINIRANIQPNRLKWLTEAALEATFNEFNGKYYIHNTECFSPSYPKPVYRYS